MKVTSKEVTLRSLQRQINKLHFFIAEINDEYKKNLETIMSEVRDVRKKNDDLSDRLLFYLETKQETKQEKKIIKKNSEKVFFLLSEEYINTNTIPGSFEEWCKKLAIMEDNITFIFHHTLFLGMQQIVQNNLHTRVTSVEYCDEKMYIYHDGVWTPFHQTHANMLINNIILQLCALYSTIVLSNEKINIGLSERNMHILSTMDKTTMKKMYSWLYDEFKNHVLNKMII